MLRADRLIAVVSGARILACLDGASWHARTAGAELGRRGLKVCDLGSEERLVRRLESTGTGSSRGVVASTASTSKGREVCSRIRLDRRWRGRSGSCRGNELLTVVARITRAWAGAVSF